MTGLSTRIIVMIIAGLAILAMIIFGVSQCQSRKTAEKQAEVSEGQAGASIGSGSEAMNTVGNVANSDAATDAAVADGQNAVRDAPEGQKGKATRSAACKLKTYANTPQCKELKQ